MSLRALLQRTVCAGEAKAHSDYPKVLCFHTEPFFIVEEERPYGNESRFNRHYCRQPQ